MTDTQTAPLTEAPSKLPATDAEADAMMIAAYVAGALEPQDHRLAAALRQQRDETRRLRRAQVELIRAAHSLMGRYNFCDMPEDDSRQWQVLADACLRAAAQPA